MNDLQPVPGDSILLNRNNFIVEGHVIFTIKTGESLAVLVKEHFGNRIFSGISDDFKRKKILLTERNSDSFSEMSKKLFSIEG